MKAFLQKIGSRINEFFRKRIVALKRHPSTIVTILLVISLLVYTIPMRHLVSTTSYVNGKNMGLATFIVTLLSILILLSINNSFPKRKKVRVPILVVTIVMIVIMIVCDAFFYGQIAKALHRPVNPIIIGDKTYITSAMNTTIAHIVCLCITLLSLATMPIYSKLFLKIDTSIKGDDESDIDEEIVRE